MVRLSSDRMWFLVFMSSCSVRRAAERSMLGKVQIGACFLMQSADVRTSDWTAPQPLCLCEKAAVRTVFSTPLLLGPRHHRLLGESLRSSVSERDRGRIVTQTGPASAAVCLASVDLAAESWWEPFVWWKNVERSQLVLFLFLHWWSPPACLSTSWIFDRAVLEFQLYFEK